MQTYLNTIHKQGHFIISANDRASIVNHEIGDEAYIYIKNYTDVRNQTTYLISAGNELNLPESFTTKYESLLDLNPLNKKSKINFYFSNINERLFNGGLFIGRYETNELKLEKRKGQSNYLFKLFPFMGGSIKKTRLALNYQSKNAYKNYRSKIDLYGRLYFYGFEIIAEKEIGFHHYFVAKKSDKPMIGPPPSNSPLIKLNRIGKDGKIIVIYKLRTMYPYSEYLQNYVYENNNLDKGGKFKDDFRISRLGKILRKYWIDELPMILNLLKGEVKFFGVRPLSCQYYNLYTEEMKALRIKVKPGLIPPYYVDLPQSFDEILDSEKKYILAYQKNPYFTDIKYMYKAVMNILVKRKRSK